MKKNITYLIIVNLFVACLLVWIGFDRIRDFKSYHDAIAKESTLSASSLVEGFIAERNRQVTLFARNNIQLIKDFILTPSADGSYLKLQRQILSYFPNYFAFNVVDKSGELARDDFDGFIGELCVSDLLDFRKRGSHLARIHPNDIAYHFDVLAPLAAELDQAVLLISFHANVMGKLLKSSETAEHQLMLIYQGASNLIEVTADGSRINWERDDYRLSKEEKSRILYEHPVAGTVWTVVDFHTPELFSGFIKIVVSESLVIMVIFIFITLMMFIQINREEKLRKQAERYKDDFLSVVSHELRTPITSIKGSLGLINNGVTGDLSPEVEQLLKIAKNNSERLALLIDDLLDLQKIEAGKMDFKFRNEDLIELVQQSITNNLGYADKFNASFELKKSVDSVSVIVDAVRIEQALSNLLSNAIKYGATNDNIEVLVELIGSIVRVSVKDHGEGIPDSFQDRVFQKFAQHDTSTTRETAGTGLGLSIVKKIIENHNGEISFETAEGVGTTFYFDLPVH